MVLTGNVIGKPDTLSLNMPLDVLSLERASYAGYSLFAYFFTGLNNLKLIYLSLVKVTNYILKKFRPQKRKMSPTFFINLQLSVLLFRF